MRGILQKAQMLLLWYKIFRLVWDGQIHQLIMVQVVHLHLENVLSDLENAFHVSTYELSDLWKGISAQSQEDLVTH